MINIFGLSVNEHKYGREKHSVGGVREGTGAGGGVILHVCRSLLWFSRATFADEIVNLHCITSWVILLLLCAVLQQPTKGGKCFYLRLYTRSRT